MIINVGRLRGWPVTITEPSLLGAQVELRPVRVRDAKVWRDARVRNAAWLRPWEPTNPETPLYRSSVGPYVAMARTMRREARQGQALPWTVVYGGRFVGQLTVGSILWGSARSGQVGYWIDEQMAGRGVIPTALARASAVGITPRPAICSSIQYPTCPDRDRRADGGARGDPH